MSKVLKAIGRVFKKVVSVAKKVLPIALAAAAVIFTGGAALGVLPTFSTAVGGLIGSLGISGTLAGALTGSIVSAGFGGAAGFVLSGGKMKGLQQGTLAGAVTGGVLGAVSPSTFGIGPSSSVSGPAISGVPSEVFNAAGANPANGLLPSNAIQAFGSGAPTAATAATASTVAAPATGGNGLLGGFFSNPTNTLMAGNVLTGLFTPSESGEAARLREREGERLFSDIYSNPNGESGVSNYGDARQAVRPVRRFRFNPETLQVEETENV